jgi:predicted ribosome quality control (RQC) complex YloA/Tae2 family protein
MEREIDPKRMRRYTLPDHWIVVVGKTDADNDYLSLKFADPRDLWFHVEGLAGSHALLLYDENREPPRAILDSAAAIAAWHSKGRNTSRIGVSCTKASQVSKRKGSPAGQVMVSAVKVLKVKPSLPEESSTTP